MKVTTKYDHSGDDKLLRDDIRSLKTAINTLKEVDSGWTTFTNLNTDRTCDADTTTVAELADILGTLIEKLKDAGILEA